jgi:hypothetical protein
MPITAQQQRTLSAGSTRIVRLNCTNDLDDGASLTGTPTVTEVTTSDLTIANKAVNSATYSDSVTQGTVAIGKAVICTVAGGTAGSTYTLRITVSTDSTPAETLVYDVQISWT